MKDKNNRNKKTLTCPPEHAMMEIKDIAGIKPATGAAKLTEEAVEKGKAWTEFTKL